MITIDAWSAGGASLQELDFPVSFSTRIGVSSVRGSLLRVLHLLVLSPSFSLFSSPKAGVNVPVNTHMKRGFRNTHRWVLFPERSSNNEDDMSCNEHHISVFTPACCAGCDR